MSVINGLNCKDKKKLKDRLNEVNAFIIYPAEICMFNGNFYFISNSLELSELYYKRIKLEEWLVNLGYRYNII